MVVWWYLVAPFVAFLLLIRWSQVIGGVGSTPRVVTEVAVSRESGISLWLLGGGRLVELAGSLSPVERRVLSELLVVGLELLPW